MARRATQPGGGTRDWFEVYPEHRIDPTRAIVVPVGVENRTIPADLVCFRYAAAFPERDLTEQAIRTRPDQARGALIEKRHCPLWCEYNSGHDPRDHLMDQRLTSLEEDRRQFQRAIDRGSKRLAIAGITIAAIVGLAQLLTATPESVVYKLLAPLFQRLMSGGPP